MTPNAGAFISYQQFSGNQSIIVGSGEKLIITHKGTICIKSGGRVFLLHDVLLVPGLKKNLLSIWKLTKDLTCSIVFTNDDFVVKDLNTQERLFFGSSFEGLHHLTKDIQANYGEIVNKEIWHSRLGHPSNKVMKSLSPFLKIRGGGTNNKDFCPVCPLGKAHQLPYKKRTSTTSQPLELVHIDLWGPSPVISVHNYVYYVSVVDDFIRFTWLFPLKNKSDFF